MNAESRTAELARRNPKIKDELLRLAAEGKIPELARLGIAADKFSATLEGRRAGRAATMEATAGPETPEAKALEAIEKYGVGSGSVRTIAGTMEIHVELERRLGAGGGGLPGPGPRRRGNLEPEIAGDLIEDIPAQAGLLGRPRGAARSCRAPTLR